jgi:peptidoglycan/LPS O-acetylase OafA/YrhL
MKNEQALAGRQIFPNLLGFRFWMANTIIYGHLEETKYLRHLFVSLDHVKRTHSIGFYPVLMFFTMSGFLITYQLEVERYNSGNVNIKKFYRNRIFRIWPLFYLSMFIYWIVLPYSFMGDYYNTIFFKPWPGFEDATMLFEIPKWILFTMSFLLMPHIAYIIELLNVRIWIYGVHHWTIGVEEIFYIFWPLAWRKMERFKSFIIKCFALYYVALAVCAVVFVIYKKVYPTAHFKYFTFLLTYIVLFTYAYCFFIGATAIYMLLHRKDLVQKYITGKLAIVCMVIMFGLMLSGFEFPFFINEIFCTAFAIFMLYLVKDGKKYAILEHPFIVYLGKITYSVYLFHFMAIVVVMYFLERYNVQQHGELVFDLLQYPLTWLLTFGFSALTHEYFEKKILAYR